MKKRTKKVKGIQWHETTYGIFDAKRFSEAYDALMANSPFHAPLKKANKKKHE